MKDKQVKSTHPPVGVLILLSLVFPGAGQLANKENIKGGIIIAATVISLIAFFTQLGFIVSYVQAALVSGVAPEVDDLFIGKLKTLGLIMAAAFGILAGALIDAIIVGARIRAGQKNR